MNGQHLQLPVYRHIAGAAQIPLVLLVWGALVLFFGHQYQAQALLPSGDKITDVVALQAEDLLRAQRRNDRLLAEMAAQAPAALPDLLDRNTFERDLAVALADSELSQGTWQPGVQEAVVKPDVAPALEKHPTPEPVVTAKPQISKTTNVVQRTTTYSQPKSAKFVRLPAVVEPKIAMRVDRLRAIKDSARAALMAGHSRAAYQRLRGQVAKGRTDIEFLGLLALASMQQQPEEAEVIYQHLMRLQPDMQRWRQGLEQTQRLLAVSSKTTAGAAIQMAG